MHDRDADEELPAGEPIHRRTLEVELGAERDGRREMRARIVDRRLHGFTVAGAQTIGPGPIHDMNARIALDVGARRIVAAEGAMALLAFYPSPLTRGESCRDSLPNFADLVGAAIDETLVASIRGAIGRERGCYHLTSLVLAAVPLLLSAVERPEPRSEPRSRTIELAATAAGGRRVRFHGLLYDRFSPRDLRRARLAFTVAFEQMLLADVSCDAAPDLGKHPSAAQALVGLPLLGGFARGAMERLRPLTGTAEILDLALSLSAIATQSFVHVRPPDEQPVAGQASRAQSTCWMWRIGGPLESLPSGRVAGAGGDFPERPHGEDADD
jgi:hypothetical protein